MSRPLKVVVVMPLSEQRGGGELMLLHLMQQGRDLGVTWHVVFLSDGPMVGQVRDFGVEASVIVSGKMREVHKLLATSQKIAALAQRFGADLILGWMGTAHLYVGPGAALKKIKAAWYQLAVPDPPDPIDKIARFLPSVGVITLSKAGRAAQQKLVPKQPIPLVYPGVELDRFDPATLPTPTDARKKLGLPEGVPLIGIVGRLQRWKGQHVFAEAMPLVAQKFPGALGVIVGGEHAFEPEYPAFLAQRIADAKAQDCVRQVGLQNNVQEWMQAMDVIVHASESEPFGIVIIEGMALGKPVIATDKGGPTEIITPQKDGLLTPFGDAPALADAICHYLADPEFAARVGAAARVRAQEFSTRKYAENLVQAVRELIGAPAI